MNQVSQCKNASLGINWGHWEGQWLLHYMACDLGSNAKIFPLGVPVRLGAHNLERCPVYFEGAQTLGNSSLLPDPGTPGQILGSKERNNRLAPAWWSFSDSSVSVAPKPLTFSLRKLWGLTPVSLALIPPACALTATLSGSRPRDFHAGPGSMLGPDLGRARGASVSAPTDSP